MLSEFKKGYVDEGGREISIEIIHCEWCKTGTYESHTDVSESGQYGGHSYHLKNVGGGRVGFFPHSKWVELCDKCMNDEAIMNKLLERGRKQQLNYLHHVCTKYIADARQELERLESEYSKRVEETKNFVPDKFEKWRK